MSSNQPLGWFRQFDCLSAVFAWVGGNGFGFTTWWSFNPWLQYKGSVRAFQLFPSTFLFATYQLDTKTGLIDYDTLEKNALLFKPKVIVAGASAYSRLIIIRVHEITNKVNKNCHLVTDMAHIWLRLLLVFSHLHLNTLDIVTTTTTSL